ncbi:MAG: DUF1189 family protein [Clostridia bacterium]|nr:DUF1189 family protein [Clostridia bacterium]
MKKKKTSFFIRIKDAVVNFDHYKTFADEKLSITIKYILKLMIIFAVIIAIALTYKLIEQTQMAIQIFDTECPNFKIENNTLIIEEENKQFVKGDKNGYFGIVINDEAEELSNINEAFNYQRVIALLNNRIIIRDAKNIESTITYEQLSNKYNLNNINKESIINFATGNNTTKIYALFVIISLIYLYVIYLIQILLDILLLSAVGYLLSKIIRVKFKYKSIFNMSVYALTLSVILYVIYIFVNLFTGFNIKYFEIAYNLIAYIYIITAMLTIKSDLTKQQIEVSKIVKEQEKVKEENKQEKQEDKKEKQKRTKRK